MLFHVVPVINNLCLHLFKTLILIYKNFNIPGCIGRTLKQAIYGT